MLMRMGLGPETPDDQESSQGETMKTIDANKNNPNFFGSVEILSIPRRKDFELADEGKSSLTKPATAASKTKRISVGNTASCAAGFTANKASSIGSSVRLTSVRPLEKEVTARVSNQAFKATVTPFCKGNVSAMMDQCLSRKE